MGRAFRPEDLVQVAALYDAYTEPLSGPTVRDARYWRGQLRTAGTPEEDFRVAERGGAIVAYARVASFNGRLRVLEYARAAHGADALAELLVAHAHGPHALHAPFVRDPELGGALEQRGIELSLARDPSPMWRVLERAPLARLAGSPAPAPTPSCSRRWSAKARRLTGRPTASSGAALDARARERVRSSRCNDTDPHRARASRAPPS